MESDVLRKRYAENDNIFVFNPGKIEFAVSKNMLKKLILEGESEDNPWKWQNYENIIKDCNAVTYGKDNVSASILLDLLIQSDYDICAMKIYPRMVMPDDSLPEISFVK